MDPRPAADDAMRSARNKILSELAEHYLKLSCGNIPGGLPGGNAGDRLLRKAAARFLRVCRRFDALSNDEYNDYYAVGVNLTPHDRSRTGLISKTILEHVGDEPSRWARIDKSEIDALVAPAIAAWKTRFDEGRAWASERDRATS